MTREELKNKLADFYHRSWSYWVKYLFSQSPINNDGSIIIPAYIVRRWQRQSTTEFKNLPTVEKDQDLLAADQIIEFLPFSKKG